MNIISAFKNSGGELGPELIIIETIALYSWSVQCGASSASDVSTLYRSTSNTHRHRSKFNVDYEWHKNSSTVSPSVISHKCDGKLPGHYNSTVSVGSISLYHVSAHLTTCLCEQSSWQTTCLLIADTLASSPGQIFRLHQRNGWKYGRGK